MSGSCSPPPRRKSTKPEELRKLVAYAFIRAQIKELENHHADNETSIYILSADDHKWLPLANHPIKLSFLQDSVTNVYRITTTDINPNDKINIPINVSAILTKCSSKFCQWQDPGSNDAAIYGFGFNSAEQTDNFFKRVKQYQMLCLQSTNIANRSSAALANTSHTNAIEQLFHSNQLQSEVVHLLKKENVKLRSALTICASNAKRWESQLESLYQQNRRLAEALVRRASIAQQKVNDFPASEIVADHTSQLNLLQKEMGEKLHELECIYERFSKLMEQATMSQ